MNEEIKKATEDYENAINALAEKPTELRKNFDELTEYELCLYLYYDNKINNNKISAWVDFKKAKDELENHIKKIETQNKEMLEFIICQNMQIEKNKDN